MDSFTGVAIVAEFGSKFKGFWIDEIEANERLTHLLLSREITVDDAENISNFMNNGYLIIPKAISEELADQLRNEMANVHLSPGKFIVRTQQKNYSYATSEALQDNQFRLIDFHVNSQLARAAIFSAPIVRFIELIFQKPLLAFQSLTFKSGSQQAIHQDGAYVVLSEALQFVASWIALEDVEEGSGELIYYPGSHRFADFLFSEKYKHWQLERDGKEQHQTFLKHLHDEAKRRGITLSKFLPKKGDALIWAADLAHGGSKIDKPHATRHSLVTHYCPSGIEPNYCNFSGTFFKQSAAVENCFYSARHYDLRPKQKAVFDYSSNSLQNELLNPAKDIIQQIEANTF